MKHTELAGVVVPAITPVDDEDRVDEAAFRKGLRRLISAGVHAIFVGGSAGEGPLLTAYEWGVWWTSPAMRWGPRCLCWAVRSTPRRNGSGKDPRPGAVGVPVLRA